MTLTTERDTVAIGSEFFRRRASDGDAPLAHGYAITCHAAQGATFERAFILADAGLCREWGYTALTRGRRDNHLYLSDDRALERDEYGPRGNHDRRGDAITRLTAALEHSDAEPLALDRGVPPRGLDSRGRGLGIGL
ncbi:MAG: helicase C-terminal domain-containing protein [Solirubrobacteraceae bacterium]